MTTTRSGVRHAAVLGPRHRLGLGLHLERAVHGGRVADREPDGDHGGPGAAEKGHGLVQSGGPRGAARSCLAHESFRSHRINVGACRCDQQARPVSRTSESPLKTQAEPLRR